MNSIETGKVLEFLMGAYPGAKGELRTASALDIWTRSLKDLTFTDVSHAVSAWILTEKWPPTIADIREKCHNLTTPPDMLASAAWDQLIRALRYSFSHESEDVWRQLPPITKEIVGGYAAFRAWGNTETQSLEAVQRPMFVKRFEAIQARDRKQSAAPACFREPRPSLPGQNIPAIADKEPDQRVKTARGVPAPADRMAELRRRLGGSRTV